MVFMSDKGSGSGDMTMRRCTTESESQLKKTCVDCGTSKTPLWRSGPDGPKSLCNACGIKSRKKRRPTASDKCSKENKKPRHEIANLNSKSIAKDECKSSEKDECKSSEKDECKSNEKKECKSSEKEECKSSEEECKNIDTEKEECKSTDKEDTEKNEMESMVKRIKMVLNGDAPRGGGSNDEADSSCCDFGEEERAAIQLMALSYGILSS